MIEWMFGIYSKNQILAVLLKAVIGKEKKTYFHKISPRSSKPVLV